MRSRSAVPGVVVSILLILAGALFFLDNIGVIRLHDLWRYWPVGIIAIGGARLFERRGMAGWTSGIFWIIAGGFLLCGNLRLLRISFDTIWPLVLIAMGVVMFTKALEHGRRGATLSPNLSPDAVREFVVFSGSKRKLDTQNFLGGEIVCVFGGVDLNLRRTAIASAATPAIVDVSITFGGVEVRVPEGWKVINRCVAMFGACEDKTLPPRPEITAQAPELVITGHVLFGAINIEN